MKSRFELFLSENQLRPSTLRSGLIRQFVKGEHRILGVGEDLAFDLLFEPE